MQKKIMEFVDKVLSFGGFFLDVNIIFGKTANYVKYIEVIVINYLYGNTLIYAIDLADNPTEITKSMNNIIKNIKREYEITKNSKDKEWKHFYVYTIDSKTKIKKRFEKQHHKTK